MQPPASQPQLLQTLEAAGIALSQLNGAQVDVLTDLSPGELKTLVLIGDDLDLSPEPGDIQQDFTGPLIF
jgi:hypothetical protein